MIDTDFEVGDDLVRLIDACVARRRSFSLEWENGLYVPGEFTLDENGKPIPHDQIPPEHIRQSPSGFRISIGGVSFENQVTHKEVLYPDLQTAIRVGGEILMSLGAR